MAVSRGSPALSRDRLLRSVDELPPFSVTLSRLLAKLARQDVLFEEVSELAEKDTVLAASLLRTVNSALYGLAGTVNSVRHALSILGLEKVRNLALTMSVMRLWDRGPKAAWWSSAQFNLHSTATAVLSDLLVQHIAADYPEGAFTAGLFHDLGKFLMATALPLEFETIPRLVEREHANLEEAETSVAGITHAELSAAALEHWNLPPAIARAVRRHHRAENSAPRPLPLASIVMAADRYVNRRGIVAPPTAPDEGGRPEEALEALGLARQIPRLVDEFNLELELTRSLF